ncbi:galactose-1-phosphate uridylyltransferase [Calycomorphotria hydatis]|uniref:Galactose-1-phosphate uridylyltransferase n=1 Tax=Calycomorphotria hydatis TaxID=2528027 RepID=A0A517T4B8_9PLAN|nr:galactose-1-phosphate uridylyltransferase [Calycomorphotria hydatis]QDT63224.1 Galactose-1-phosphate uridylyltransferase [Calycomorphotria hydatis]
MPELRKDPIVGRWVIIAPDRAKRPIDFENAYQRTGERFDPFAEGNEKHTPHEIIAYRNNGSAANGPGWRVRVVPNKFPALVIEGDLGKRGEGIYDAMNGVGAHEVIIECPHFEENMSRLSVENIREVLWAYRDRLVDLKKDRRLVHGLIFKNKGAAAGASLEHSHSQLIVTSVVPISVWEEMTGALEFYNYRGRCIYEDIVRQELTTGSRIVYDTPGFLVFCPYASRFPFETWIVPKQHGSHYEDIQRQQLEELGAVLKTTLGKLELALDDPPYNYVLHTAPFDTPKMPHYRWHIEIFPRITQVAGFEWGSGFYINPVTPEDAASFLREVEVPVDHGATAVV